jgi:hypothetical protein
MANGAASIGELRALVMKVVLESERTWDSLQMGTVLQEVAQQAKARGPTPEVDMLTAFYDLFRTGQLSWGSNFCNAVAPWFHVTQMGRRTLERLSRDPCNAAGYLAYLKERAELDEIELSYVEESVSAFNADCHRAAAVMIGVAAEALLLRLRDLVVAKFQECGVPTPKGVDAWQAARVHGALSEVLDSRRDKMAKDLAQRFDANWQSLSNLIRLNRNDAGHPKPLPTAGSESVHATLLVFPEYAHLVAGLHRWFTSGAA